MFDGAVGSGGVQIDAGVGIGPIKTGDDSGCCRGMLEIVFGGGVVGEDGEYEGDKEYEE